MTTKPVVPMNLSPFTTTFHKIFFILFTFLTTLTLIAASIFFSHEKRDLIIRVENQEQVVVTTGSKLIKDIVDPIIIDLNFLADLSEDIFSSLSATSDYTDLNNNLENLMLLFAGSRPIYDQIRYIDSNGRERIRINNPSSGPPFPVPKKNLQDKSSRYYFIDTFSLAREDTYISPIDLNIEQGEIEKPFKPMIRFGRPIFNSQGEKIGVVILNYKAAYLFKKLKFWTDKLFGELTLLNRNGYWLHARNKEDEWGFMLPERKNKTLKLQKPDLWNNIINANESGQTHHIDGIYTFQTIRPIQNNFSSSSGSSSPFGISSSKFLGKEYYWKLVSFVANEDITAILNELKRKFSIFLAAIIGILAIFSYFLAKTQAKRRQFEDVLRFTNTHLEETVEKRTKELFNRNIQLTEEVQTRREIEKALASSEERYRSIMKAMDDGVYITSPAYTVTYANPALLKRIGIDPTGENCYKAIYNRDNKCPWCIFDDLVEGSPSYYEISSREDEKVFHVSNTIINYDGGSRGKLTIFRDITNYKKTQAELAERELQYTTLIQTMREGLLSIDGKAQITFCNTSFCQMLDRAKEDIIGMPVSHFLDDENKATFEKELAKRHLEIAEPYEITWKKESKKKIITIVSPAILRDREGNYIGSLGVVSDITAAKAAEAEKHSLESQLQQAQKMEALGTLTGGIAHDFNNILSAILGFGEIASELADKRKDHEMKELLDEILTAGRRATQLVKQILAFSRQTKQNRQPLAIEPIIKEAIKLIRAATSATVSINFSMQDDIGQILADPTQIHQIIMNLSTNACQAMMPSGGTLKISLNKEKISVTQAGIMDVQPGDFVCLTVSDTGCGIPEEIIARVFDPFFTTKEVGKGTGLGLSVVHSMIKDLDGAIRVVSKEGGGTTFQVFLPITKQEESSQPVIAERIFRGSGERVAWVDDEEPLVSLGCHVLRSLGYKATGYTDPQKFLDRVMSDPDIHDLVISDLNMPFLNGLEMFKRLKPINSSIPFILCSGFSDEINEDNVRQMGLEAFLMKPVRKSDIALAVYSALNHSTEVV